MCLCSTVAELAFEFDGDRALSLASELHHHLAAVRSILANSRQLSRQVGFQVILTASQSRTLKVRSARATEPRQMDKIYQYFSNRPQSFWLSRDRSEGGVDEALSSELRRRLTCISIDLRSSLITDDNPESWVSPDLVDFTRGHKISELRYAGKKYIKMARKLGGVGSMLWLPLDVPSSTYERYLNMDDEDAFSHLRSLRSDDPNYADLVRELLACQFNDIPRTALYDLHRTYPDFFLASDRLLLLLHALGGRKIPVDIFRALQKPRRAWGHNGEVMTVTADEYGIDRHIIALGDEQVIAQTSARTDMIIQETVEGVSVMWSLKSTSHASTTDTAPMPIQAFASSSSSLSSWLSSPSPLLGAASDTWVITALRVLCYSCPLTFEGKVMWTRNYKQVMWTLFDRVITSAWDDNSIHKVSLNLRNQAVEALLFFAERDQYAIRHMALQRARSLLLPAMDFYYHASVTLFESVLMRLESRFRESNDLIGGFVDSFNARCSRVVAPLQNALLGRLHVSWLENKIHCYDDDVGTVMYVWGGSAGGSDDGHSLASLSTFEIEVTRRLQGTAAKYFHSVGDFEQARTSLEQHLLLVHTQPVRNNTRLLITTKLAETHCELLTLDRAASLVRDALARLPADCRSTRPYRRLAMADVEIKLMEALPLMMDGLEPASRQVLEESPRFIGPSSAPLPPLLSSLLEVERILATLVDVEPPELDDLNDQVLHMRCLLLMARAAHQRALCESVLEVNSSCDFSHRPLSPSWHAALRAWYAAIQQAQALSIFAVRHPWTPVVAHLSIAHIELLLGRGAGGLEDTQKHCTAAEKAWATASAISSVERCEYILPTLATAWVPLMVTAVRREHPTWTFRMMLPGGRSDVVWL